MGVGGHELPGARKRANQLRKVEPAAFLDEVEDPWFEDRDAQADIHYVMRLLIYPRDPADLSLLRVEANDAVVERYLFLASGDRRDRSAALVGGAELDEERLGEDVSVHHEERRVEPVHGREGAGCAEWPVLARV